MVYGPGFEEGYFTILRYLEEGKMQIIGDGANRIPLVHINDVVSAILLALDKPVPHCREYNIVGFEQLTQQQLLAAAAQELGVAVPEKHIHPAMISVIMSMQGLAGKKASLGPESIRQLTLDRAYSCKRAKKELGWEPQVKLADGIREMVQLYKAGKTG